MSFTSRSCARRALVMAVGFLVALAARPALSDVDVRFERIDGIESPGTPADLNKVGVLEIGPQRAGISWFSIRARRRAPRTSRRLRRPSCRGCAAGRSGPSSGGRICSRITRCSTRQGRDCVADGRCSTTTSAGSRTTHHRPLPAHPRLRRRLRARVGHERRDRGSAARRAAGAEAAGSSVVLGGHSLGGSITAAYATWDFDGEPGAKELAGLVFIDGGSSPTPSRRRTRCRSSRSCRTARRG